MKESKRGFGVPSLYAISGTVQLAILRGGSDMNRALNASAVQYGQGVDPLQLLAQLDDAYTSIKRQIIETYLNTKKAQGK